jgi:hypothetical protein
MATGAEEKVGGGGDDVAHGVIELSKEEGQRLRLRVRR